jgi:hypothetical protein
MSNDLLKQFLAVAAENNITHLNPRAQWKPDLPNSPGHWWMLCDEAEGEAELVKVELRANTLWAVDTNTGTLPLKDLHDGLTNCRWQPEENAYL